MRADIIVYDGLDELDAIGPLEVLRSATLVGADVSARLVTRAPQEILTGAHGLRLIPDGVFVPGEANVIIVAGGGWVARSEAGVHAEVARGEWPRLLANAPAGADIVAAVCTGSMLLAHAGLIGNRRATTHHAAWEDLAATGATLVRNRVVDDGDLVTTAA
jgi:putative intracellular protease/amidase